MFLYKSKRKSILNFLQEEKSVTNIRRLFMSLLSIPPVAMQPTMAFSAPETAGSVAFSAPETAGSVASSSCGGSSSGGGCSFNAVA